MSQIEQLYIIRAALPDVWNAFFDTEAIEKWGGGPAEVGSEVGSTFSLWGGDIHGTTTAIIPNERIEQDWYGGAWAQPSKVVFVFKQTDEWSHSHKHGTQVQLFQDGVPEESVDDIEEGWAMYYLGPMKVHLEEATFK